MSPMNAATDGGSGSGGNVKRDDYCAYVMGIERKTSMCEGPHFPNLQAAFKSKADQEQQQRRPGLFQHLESFEERLAGGRTN
ncbi:hypothetical protein KFK09_002000 [Dendrobium nobile]|uniref:Uncharacterized protein n=1 Tax=Dendrobium nobile TaxID=94219 RepID=A0A8T3C6J4_DENNO|nr:hypothetical protein KFK09_002000 [Dendrobium nobile]